MKTIIRVSLFVLLTVVVSYSSIFFYAKIKFAHITTLTLDLNKEITEIKCIHQIGHWGEWFSEYVLIVEMNDQNYRIWVNGNGEITDHEKM